MKDGEIEVGVVLELRKRRDGETREGQVKFIYPRYLVVEFNLQTLQGQPVKVMESFLMSDVQHNRHPDYEFVKKSIRVVSNS